MFPRYSHVDQEESERAVRRLGNWLGVPEDTIDRMLDAYADPESANEEMDAEDVPELEESK